MTATNKIAKTNGCAAFVLSSYFNKKHKKGTEILKADYGLVNKLIKIIYSLVGAFEIDVFFIQQNVLLTLKFEFLLSSIL